MHSDESNPMMLTGDYACYDKSASKQDKLLWWSRSKPYDFALYYGLAEKELTEQLHGTCICGRPLHVGSHTKLCMSFIKRAHELTIAKLEQKYDLLYGTARY